MKNDYLQRPVIPFEVSKDSSVAQLLKKMEELSFQGRNLGRAFLIWQEMLRRDTIIFLGLAGAMVPAGMRKVISYLIEKRLIDCLVSTGANLFHDIHESLGKCHWQGEPEVDDVDLREHGIDRIYDTYASEKEFSEADKFITAFVEGLNFKKSYTTREFLYLLGKKLVQDGKEKGILTCASQHGVPIYCPAISDSSIGIVLTLLYSKMGKSVVFDVIGDVREMGRLVAEASSTGVIYVGGGVPKNFIQQAEITAAALGWKPPGHQYAIQITTDAPHWGGLSGCTFEEAQSWGKVAKQAQKATLYCDATIALPILVTALSQEDLIKKRKRPRLEF